MHPLTPLNFSEATREVRSTGRENKRVICGCNLNEMYVARRLIFCHENLFLPISFAAVKWYNTVVTNGSNFSPSAYHDTNPIDSSSRVLIAVFPFEFMPAIRLRFQSDRIGFEK